MTQTLSRVERRQGHLARHLLLRFYEFVWKHVLAGTTVLTPEAHKQKAYGCDSISHQVLRMPMPRSLCATSLVCIAMRVPVHVEGGKPGGGATHLERRSLIRLPHHSLQSSEVQGLIFPFWGVSRYVRYDGR